jgi:hypothetical protein
VEFIAIQSGEVIKSSFDPGAQHTGNYSRPEETDTFYFNAALIIERKITLKWNFKSVMLMTLRKGCVWYQMPQDILYLIFVMIANASENCELLQ